MKSRRLKVILGFVGYAILIALAVFVLRFIFIAQFYGYRHGYPHSDFLKTPFKESVSRYLIRQEVYGTRSGDSVLFCDYVDSTRIMVWKLAAYSSVSTSRIKFVRADVVAAKKDYKDAVIYDSFGGGYANPYGFTTRLLMKEALNLTVKVDQDTGIDTLIRTQDFVYYSLKFNRMAFYGDNGLDAAIQKAQEQSKANAMFYKRGGEFYFILQYPLNKSRLPANSLLKLIESPSFARY
jgi:hypothetical protein